MFSNLQPLHVCLSHQGALKVVNGISEGHDIDVQEWCDNLRSNIPNTETTPSVSVTTSCCTYCYIHHNITEHKQDVGLAACKSIYIHN